MREALANQPDIPFRIPTGIKLVRINHDTGKPATPADKSVIVEALKPDFDFDKSKQRVISGGTDDNSEADAEDDKNMFQSDEESDDFQVGTQY